MNKRVYVILIIFVLLACACGSNSFVSSLDNTTNRTTPEFNTGLDKELIESKSEIEAVQLGEYDISAKSYDNSDVNKQININILYPEISGLSTMKLQNKVNALIKETALKPYNNIVKTNNGIVQGTDWSVDNTIEYATNTVISIKFEGYLYAQGNANGINWVYSVNIDLTSGKKITYADIFQDSFKEKLDYRFFNCIDVDTIGAEEIALKEIFDNYKSNFEMNDDNFYFTKENFIIILPIGDYYQFSSDYKDLKSSMREDNLIWSSISNNN